MLLTTVVNRKCLYQGQPTTSSATLYTVPASTDAMLKSIVLANTSGSPATITLYRVPTGGSAGVTNCIVPTFTVAANDTVTLDSGVCMTAGDFIAGLQGTTGAITATISGETYA